MLGQCCCLRKTSAECLQMQANRMPAANKTLTEGHPSSMLHLSIPTECSDQNRPHKYLKRGGNASVLAIVRHLREMMLFNISSSNTVIMIIITIL